MSCLFNACSHRQNPCRALLLTPLVHLAHAGTEPGLDEAFDPVGLPGDWWIRTRTQEAVVLCGMNDCGERGIEGTAQAQRELFQVAGRGGTRRARGRGRYGGGAGGGGGGVGGGGGEGGAGGVGAGGGAGAAGAWEASAARAGLCAPRPI